MTVTNLQKSTTDTYPFSHMALLPSQIPLTLVKRPGIPPRQPRTPNPDSATENTIPAAIDENP